MAFDLDWRTEDCTVLETFDHRATIEDIVHAAGDESICLRFVDPYGLTVFNAPQQQVVVGELNQIRRNLEASGRASTHVDAMLEFINRRIGQVHVYLVFVGD